MYLVRAESLLVGTISVTNATQIFTVLPIVTLGLILYTTWQLITVNAVMLTKELVVEQNPNLKDLEALILANLRFCMIVLYYRIWD